MTTKNKKKDEFVYALESSDGNGLDEILFYTLEELEDYYNDEDMLQELEDGLVIVYQKVKTLQFTKQWTEVK